MIKHKLLWKLLPKIKKDSLLSSMSILERRQFQKKVNGRCFLPDCFQSAGAVYVHVPKVAGKSICKLFFNGENLGHMPYIWYEKIAPATCASSFTFSFVRNPWDRVVSAYHYLLSGGALKRDGDISKELSQYKNFDDFVLFWLRKDKLDKHVHFVPQYEFLINDKGTIDLDFVGQYERMDQDIKEICGRLNLHEGKHLELQKVNASQRESYQKYYSEGSMEIVADLYRTDIKMFGYAF
ncbi:sulfotransferase family 2 domain-containing protein [Porticoccus sp.]